MKNRFKKGDWICYVDRSISRSAIGGKLPIIQSGYIRDCFPGGYTLRNSVTIYEPFAYTTVEEAKFEHATALLEYLKVVSETMDAVVAKLKEYGLESFDIGDQESLGDLLYVRERVEHIRSIREDKRTPEMVALLFAVDHPSVEDP